jgi:hypothetical protein
MHNSFGGWGSTGDGLPDIKKKPGFLSQPHLKSFDIPRNLPSEAGLLAHDAFQAKSGLKDGGPSPYTVYCRKDNYRINATHATRK